MKRLTMKRRPALLALENGVVFTGYSTGVEGARVGEVVFNTAMTGYQEILSDPSYAQQLVTLTCPHIGNVGCNPDDDEAAKIWASGLIVRAASLCVSNWRSRESLTEYLHRHHIVAIEDIDTRALTHLLRDQGAMRGCLMAGDVSAEEAIAQAKTATSLVGCNLAEAVSTTTSYRWSEGTLPGFRVGHGQPTNQRFHVVAYDFGVKRQILRLLVDRGCDVTVIPANTPALEVLNMKPDGVFLSNGPGDPAACESIVKQIQVLLREEIPLFGICLGFQLLALALGGRTKKMKFGHHGANHPVVNVASNRVSITSQNHGFCVDEASLPRDFVVTHRSLFDQTLQGARHGEKPVFGFQGHPEASPGPHDTLFLFDNFITDMAQHQAVSNSVPPVTTSTS